MVILASAYGAACAAAGASIGLFIALAYTVEMLVHHTPATFPRLALLAVTAVGLVAIGGLWGTIFGGGLIAAFSLPTSILLIICSERANVRLWWVYGICGAANGLVLSAAYFFIVDPIVTKQTAAISADLKCLAAIAVCSIAGGSLLGP